MPNETENQLATKKVPLPIGPKGIQLESFEALWRFAQCIAASPFAPRGMEKAEAIVPAIQLGLEIGLSPMSALQNVAVINGRPGIYGDAALALVRASGRCEYYTQTIEGEGDERTATVTSKRDDSPEPIITTFGVKDAKRAGLWGKQGPWSQYPDRMLLFRARGFNLRDNFGDILKGMHTLEELRDLDMKPVQGREVASDIRFEEPETEGERFIKLSEAAIEESLAPKRKRRPLSERFFEKTKKNEETGCLEWTSGIAPNGYGQFKVGDQTLGAHRIAWELANGAVPEGMYVLHKCDVPHCVNIEHLFLGTPQDNMDDKVAKGRESHFAHERKFTAQAIEEIKSAYESGNESQEAIAKRFGTSQSHVSNIVAGRVPPNGESKPEAPPRATPLEGLRNLIAASPITEFQLEQRLIKKGIIGPTGSLDRLSDEKLLEIQMQFMALATEIVDAP